MISLETRTRFGELESRAMDLLREEDPLGIWAYAYYRATGKVVDHLGAGKFAAPDLINRQLRSNTERYLAALDKRKQWDQVARVWGYSFRHSIHQRFSFLQHLYLGLNAAVNYQLIETMSETFSPAELDRMKSDFDTVDKAQESLYEDIQDWIEGVYLSGEKGPTGLPGWGQFVYQPFGPGALLKGPGMAQMRQIWLWMQKSITGRQRQQAFTKARDLAALSPDGRRQGLSRLDGEVLEWSRAIVQPPPGIRELLSFMKDFEPNLPSEIVNFFPNKA